MGFLGSVLSGAMSLGKKFLKSFNPFNNDDFKNAPREEQDRFQEKIEVIANDKTLDHEYRMEAQRVLAKIESYRHAEELARIEGTTKITIAQIEATKDMVIAKVELLKEDLKRISNKEVALINAMGSSENLTDVFLERLDKTGDEVKAAKDSVEIYTSEVSSLNYQINKNFDNKIEDKSGEIIEEKLNNYDWSKVIFEWADENNISEEDIPRDTKKLIKLEKLAIFGDFESIPKEIGMLLNLNYIMIRGNIHSIPRELCNLKNLEQLIIDGNLLNCLPGEIVNLKKLKGIQIQNNAFFEFPDQLFEITSLESIYVSCNMIREIPNDVSKLLNLKVFDAYGNKLTSLPSGLFSLRNLKKMFFSNNDIELIPDDIKRLENLEYLDLKNNKIKTIPKELTYLNRLTDLILDKNEIELIPDEISNLESLISLSLNGNKIRQLPMSLSRLNNLSTLKLNDNLIFDYPECINEFSPSKFMTIYLLGNRMVKLPKSFFDMFEKLGDYKNYKNYYLPESVFNRLPGELKSILSDYNGPIFKCELDY